MTKEEIQKEAEDLYPIHHFSTNRESLGRIHQFQMAKRLGYIDAATKYAAIIDEKDKEIAELKRIIEKGQQHYKL